MFKIIKLFKNILVGSNELSKLEQAIFNSVRENLKPDNIILWDKQLSAINRIHRSPDGLEMNMYVMQKGKAKFPSDICFKNQNEFKIAIVDLMDIESAHKLRARIWCVSGHVFSIEYKTSFKDFEKASQGEWKIHCHIEMEPAL